jgi:cytochrome c biogenesis protein CcdA
MVGLTLVVASIALADSINPSTLIPALWMASAPAKRRLASYTLGVFVVYLSGGIVLLLGPGPTLISFLHHLRGPVEHGVEVLAGVVALGAAVVLWHSRYKADGKPRVGRIHTPASAFALGAGIMAIELPTAFMYFGAISALLAAHPSAPVAILLLVAYNALFVTPLIALVVATRLAGARTEQWIASASDRLRSLGQLALTAVAGAAGATLLVLGLSGLLVA